jgi:glutamate-1-semialdehyde 2,1-aminomutase
MINPIAMLAGGAVAGLAFAKGRERLQLSRAKHPGLSGHVRMAKRVAGQIPFYSYPPERFYAADGAPAEVAERRRAGFERLAADWSRRFAKSIALTKETREGLSDLQFTGRYRVPFQFSAAVREALPVGAFLERSEGPILHDLDGNRLIDLTGSYGVNLLGYEAYKEMIREGAAAVEALGPVLGQYHPLVADNVRRLKALTGMDKVSFHMSGTEAVMQAVRLARYHTGRRRLVRFAGAYHGWGGDVQPGIGNPVPADDTLTLAEMSDKTLDVLRRRKDVACVLVNPIQALHPNAAAAGDSQLVDSAGRKARFDREAYADWLKWLAAVCRDAGIVLIFDEVFVGFRLAPGGAAEYFGVKPDLVTYGKTLGGGLPVGVICGRSALMKRWRDDRPVDIMFARGTFNAHPYVMGAMDAFLRRLERPETAALYAGLDTRWEARLARFNDAMRARGLPVEAAGMQSIWTVLYTRPSRYNWMLQYYLRAEGLALSWVGTGRLIFSFDIDDALFSEIVERFATAAARMEADGWWWGADGVTDKKLRRAVLKETVMARLGRSAHSALVCSTPA